MEQEKTSRDKQIDALNEDISKQEEGIAKLNKEKKNLNESLEERTEQLQAAEDKCSSLNKAKNKVEGQLKDVSNRPHDLAWKPCIYFSNQGLLIMIIKPRT